MSNIANFGGEWRNGCLEFRDTSGRVVNVIAATVVNDDFLGGAVDTTNDWVFAAVNSGAIARTAAAGGVARITTGGADDDDADLATPLNYLPSKGCSIEARVAANDVAGTAFNVGFSDATGEAADLIAVTFSGTTLTTTATDCAVFFHDADATTDLIRAVAVKNDVDGTVFAHSAAPVNGEYNVYRVDIDQSGNVTFTLNGVVLGTQAAGITTSAALCGYIAVINREGSANTLDVDYVRAWAWSR